VAALAHPVRERSPITPGCRFPVDIRPWAARKLEALAAHRSQALSVRRAYLDRPDRERRLAAEVFRQAWGPPLARRPLDDVLAGLWRS